MIAFTCYSKAVDTASLRGLNLSPPHSGSGDVAIEIGIVSTMIREYLYRLKPVAEFYRAVPH